MKMNQMNVCVGRSGAGRICRLYGCRGEEQRVRHRHSGRMIDNTSVCSRVLTYILYIHTYIHDDEARVLFIHYPIRN